MKYIVGFFCAASAFPAMLFERLLPLDLTPDPAKIVWEEDRSYYHNYKNYWTEFVRNAFEKDAQWCGKFIAFLLVVLAVL